MFKYYICSKDILMRNKNLTYLIGAGASAKALPVINKMRESIDKAISFMKVRYTGFDPNLFKPIQQKSFDQIILDLQYLKQKCEGVNTIDESAQMLYAKYKKNIKNGKDDIAFEFLNEFKKLKSALSIYFIIEEYLISPKIDARYNPFWLNIDHKNIENVKILSWNYDSQFERSYSNLYSMNLDESRNELNFVDCGFSNYMFTTSHSKIELIKLNGSADNFSKSGKDSNFPVKNTLDIGFKDVLNHYSNSDFSSSLRYAFENDEEQITNIRTKIINAVRGTTHFVVIGYSFPDCNRIIDKDIFNQIIGPETNVYFVNITDEDFYNVTDLINLTNYKKVQPQFIKNGDKFYFPPDF